MHLSDTTNLMLCRSGQRPARDDLAAELCDTHPRCLSTGRRDERASDSVPVAADTQPLHSGDRDSLPWENVSTSDVRGCVGETLCACVTSCDSPGSGGGWNTGGQLAGGVAA